jgi:hypothetical protein
VKLDPSLRRPPLTRCRTTDREHRIRAGLLIVPGRTPVASWPHEPGHDATCPSLVPGSHAPCLCGIGAR